MRGTGFQGVVKVQQNKAAKTLFINIPKETADDLGLQPQRQVQMKKDIKTGRWYLDLFIQPTQTTEDTCYA